MKTHAFYTTQDLSSVSMEIGINTLHTTPYVNVTWLNGNTVAVNREIVYLSEHTYQVRLRGFLKSKKGRWLKSQTSSLAGYRSLTTSRTRRWNEKFWINNSVDFWYFLISRRATVPGRYLLRLRIDPECRCRRVFPSPVTALDDVLVRVISRTIRNNW